MSRTVILETRDVHKVYPIGRYSKQNLHVLKGIDLQVQQGEIVVIVGASGAGKSTLLHILGALDRPNEGKVLHNGLDVFSLDDQELARFRNKEVGFVFQFHHLLPEFTALENVAMPMMIWGKKFSEARTKSADLLQKVGLRERADHRPPELSGGEQQRVAVARALMNDPSIILGDEPSGNLDSSGAA
ncbi:MAG: ABC transporter ATP-binding protein, partial [Bacteroidota bacterium]